MRQVSVFLDRWVQKNFQGKGEQIGGWPAYKYGGRLVVKAKSNSYAMDAKRYINTSAALLQDTGRLRMSFLPFVRKGIAGIGSDLPYSKPHEEGSDNLPQRRMLPKNAEVQTDIFEILQNFVVVQFRKSGLT
jgi:phage gpG-like protein